MKVSFGNVAGFLTPLKLSASLWRKQKLESRSELVFQRVVFRI